jgi:hypothetical protein
MRSHGCAPDVLPVDHGCEQSGATRSLPGRDDLRRVLVGADRDDDDDHRPPRNELADALPIPIPIPIRVRATTPAPKGPAVPPRHAGCVGSPSLDLGSVAVHDSTLHQRALAHRYLTGVADPALCLPRDCSRPRTDICQTQSAHGGGKAGGFGEGLAVKGRLLFRLQPRERPSGARPGVGPDHGGDRVVA